MSFSGLELRSFHDAKARCPFDVTMKVVSRAGPYLHPWF